MAGGLTERLSFLLELDTAGAIRNARQFGDAAEREMGRASSSFERIGGRAQVAGAGMVAFAGIAGGALYGFARASEEAEGFHRRLEQAISTNASMAATGIKPFEDLAASIQDLTGADGDAIVGLEGFLGTLGRTSSEVTTLTPLIVDLATRYGLGFEQAGRLVNSAVEGNTTRLERLIGPLGDAESVTDALRRTVGGFAEREAQSLSGQLNIMKQNAGDLAEGLGVGVVGAINSVAGPLSGFVGRLSDTNPKLLETTGRIAAFGTAGIGAIGGLSFLVGTIAKLDSRFRTLDVETGTRSLNNFGKVAAGLGAAGAIAAVVTGLSSMSNEMRRLKVDIDAFSSGDNLDDLISEGALDKMHRFGQSNEDIARALVEQNIPAAERFAAALERDGQSADGVRAIIDEKRASDVQAAADQDQNTAAIEAGTEALEGEGGSLRDVNALLEDNRRRNDEARQATQDRADALIDAVGGDIAYRDSLRQTNDALTTYMEKAGDSETSADDLAQAQDDAAQAALDQGQAAVDAAVQIAEAGGATVTANERAAIMRTELQKVAHSLDPGSPLRVQLQGYIDQLNAIPQTLTTNIETVYRAPTGNVPAGQTPVQRRAKGGPVEKDTAYLVGDKYGLQNAELFVPDKDGYVVPNVTTTKGTAVGSGAGGSWAMGGVEDRLDVMIALLRPSTAAPARPTALRGMAARDALAQQRAGMG